MRGLTTAKGNLGWCEEDIAPTSQTAPLFTHAILLDNFKQASPTAEKACKSQSA
jgi:hypothetical protein